MSNETKRCPKCERDLSTDQFNKRSNGNCYAYCRPCQTDYLHEHYVKNAPVYKKRRRESSRRYFQRDRAYVIEYLRSHPCVDCGENDPIVLEFDHVDAKDKDTEVASLVRWGCSLSRLQREIAKCAVRCVHCHRHRTAIQFGWSLGQ